MADVVDTRTRSRMMAGIGTKNTRPELVVRKCLFKMGLRYRLHRRDLPGAPDVVLPKRRIAVLVHGCFWHSHPNCRLVKAPTTNPEFWRLKLAKNVSRDRRSTAELIAAGWRVLVVWECATRGTAAGELPSAMSDWIAGDGCYGEVPRCAAVETGDGRQRESATEGRVVQCSHS